MANGKLRIKGVTTGGNSGGTNFISVWDTTLGNGYPTIILPLESSGNYNFTVNWGDGNTDTITAWDQAEVTHTYTTGGVYTVIITGTIEGWSFNYGGDCEKLTSITNLGQLKLGNTGFNFVNCFNLTTVNGILDLTGTSNLNELFAYCSSLNNIPNINSWDVSSVTNMNGLFKGTLFNQPLNNWNVSNVTDMSNMFNNATLFNQPLNSWNVSSLLYMSSMFENATAFNQPLNSWNVSSVINMNSTFFSTTSFNQDISSWNISNVTDMSDFMYGKSTANYSYYDNLLNAWSLLTLQNGVYLGMGTIEYTSASAAARQSIIDTYGWTIDDGGQYFIPFVSVWDTILGNGISSITLPLVASGNYNFTVNWGDGNTDTITTYDQAEVTHTYETSGVYTVTITGTIEGWSFNNSGDNQKLISIEDLGSLNLGVYNSYNFAGCTNLTTVNGILDLSNTQNLGGLFYNCSNLINVPNINSWNLSSVVTLDYMFYNATSFNQDISGWNVSNVTNMSGMFAGAIAFNQDISSWDIRNVIICC